MSKSEYTLVYGDKKVALQLDEVLESLPPIYGFDAPKAQPIQFVPDPDQFPKVIDAIKSAKADGKGVHMKGKDDKANPLLVSSIGCIDRCQLLDARGKVVCEYGSFAFPRVVEDDDGDVNIDPDTFSVGCMTSSGVDHYQSIVFKFDAEKKQAVPLHVFWNVPMSAWRTMRKDERPDGDDEKDDEDDEDDEVPCLEDSEHRPDEKKSVS